MYLYIFYKIYYQTNVKTTFTKTTGDQLIKNGIFPAITKSVNFRLQWSIISDIKVIDPLLPTQNH